MLAARIARLAILRTPTKPSCATYHHNMSAAAGRKRGFHVSLGPLVRAQQAARVRIARTIRGSNESVASVKQCFLNDNCIVVVHNNVIKTPYFAL